MRTHVLAIVAAVLLCLLAALGTASGSPDTVTVNSTTDVSDGDTSSFTNLQADPGGDGAISLREAIEVTNNSAGTDTIAFNIPTTDTGYQVSGITGTWTISLASPLPTLTDGGTIISGTTQAANQGDLNPDGPEIEISGASLSTAACLVIESANNVVHGLVINQCPTIGVLIQTTGADYNTVSGNYIGTDASGSSDLGNGTAGVVVSYGPQGNVVGGDTSGERNVVSGNDQYGVYIFGGDADGNTVSGNFVGTDATGAQGLGNSQAGVVISYGAQYNTIGGGTEGERNIISGNGGMGVSISESDTMSNTVSGNYIGTVVSGTQALGNTGDGVVISAGSQYNTVGGDSEGERNVISANSRGVMIVGSGTVSNTVSGNYIGTDVAGSSDLGNTFCGIEIASGAQNNSVGGQTAAERNVISGNNWYGVQINGSGADDNVVSGNYIGTDVGGTQDLGNSFDGVLIAEGAQDNTIGGQTAGERNVIAGNEWSGVQINGAGTDWNTVSGNFIGTDVSGTEALGNASSGVYVRSSAQNNTVGGDTEGERNVISANSTGVSILGANTMSNTVSGNYIGTDVAGSSDLGNTGAGVAIQLGAQYNTIGGQTAGERNVISGNNSGGVLISGSGTDGNTVCGNCIGTDAGGTQELGNTGDGAMIDTGAQDNTIGGETVAEGNVIAASTGSGVHIRSAGTDGNTVSHNYIGSDVTGTQDRGNGYDGVRIENYAEDNTVGPNNLIAYNDLRGVSVGGPTTTTGNTITQDSIHSNVGLGIDLWSGGNDEIPAPTVSSVDACFGTVSGTAGAGDTVEVFTGPDEEGKTYLATDVADGGGDWEVAGPFSFDTYVTATATDASGNTSEFSSQVEAHCYLVMLPLGMKQY